MLFIDPYDLIIGAGTPTVPLGGTAQNPSVASTDPPTTGTSYIAPATLQAASQNGAVSISIATSHDLTVQQAINLAQGTTSVGGSSGGASLSLNAGHDLNVLANITLGTLTSQGTVPTLTLAAGHNLYIGPAGGSPAVTITAVGNIALATTANPGSDPLASSITIHDNSVITTQGGFTLQASNRVDIGSGVQLSAGPKYGLTTSDGSLTGINVQAGSDITVANNSRLSVSSPSVGAGYSGRILLDAGGNVSIGTGSQLNAGGSNEALELFAGNGGLHANNSNAPAPSPAGSLTLGSGSILTGASSISLQSGSAGTISLAAGSTVSTTSAGSWRSKAAAAAISLAGSASGKSVYLSASGAVTEPASGVLTATDLQGSAGSFDLGGTGNRITSIGTGYAESLVVHHWQHTDRGQRAAAGRRPWRQFRRRDSSCRTGIPSA